VPLGFAKNPAIFIPNSGSGYTHGQLIKRLLDLLLLAIKTACFPQAEPLQLYFCQTAVDFAVVYDSGKGNEHADEKRARYVN
jgi:hypothetical protein